MDAHVDLYQARLGYVKLGWDKKPGFETWFIRVMELSAQMDAEELPF